MAPLQVLLDDNAGRLVDAGTMGSAAADSQRDRRPRCYSAGLYLHLACSDMAFITSQTVLGKVEKDEL